MINVISTKGWALVIGLVVLVLLSPAVIHAQAGNATVTVNACTDQNADGDCDDLSDVPALPSGVEACLTNGSGCQPVPASFTDLAAGTYTTFLRFTGASQGYYPTTGRVYINLAADEQVNITLGAVYPVHPKGVAIHEQLNKVYVAFHGPISDTEKPYPFVAVIDGITDEVRYTIPGGTNSIGRSPWGVAVSGNNVYVSSFEDGRITVIDATSDTVIGNIDKTDLTNVTTEFQPTIPSVDPLNGRVHFPDYRGGRLVILEGTSVVADPDVHFFGEGFSPFEMVTATKTGGTYNFITLRDAVQPATYKFVGLNSTSLFEVTHHDTVGSPHAIGLWQETGMTDPRLFITYADDPRVNPPSFINPNKLVVYSFSVANPQIVSQHGANIGLGDYAEAGLVYDSAAGQMRGTFAGFAYDENRPPGGHEAACNHAARGGTYGLDFNGGVLPGFEPDVVVGNPRLVSDNLQWKNPFEIAINSNNGKIYVTDRCWNDYPEGGQPGGGAVLIFHSKDLPGIYLPIVLKNSSQ